MRILPLIAVAVVVCSGILCSAVPRRSTPRLAAAAAKAKKPALPKTRPVGPLGQRIQKLLDASPVARQAFWGIRVLNAATGQPIHALNDERFFVPASNTKLFTTALALSTLGPDYRHQTVIHSDVPPNSAGEVGELRLIGGGDPNLSARTLPYKRNSAGPNPLAAIEALADQAVARGLRAVTGDIVGDDTAYVWEPYPSGWSVDDPLWEYGAPVSALTLNDNAFALSIEPATVTGVPAVLSIKPAIEYFVVHNRTRTVASPPASLNYERLPGSRELVVEGTVALGSERRSTLLAVDDPAWFAAYALRDALLERGVRVAGSVRAHHRRANEELPAANGVELARHTSAPLAQSLQVINKVSQNLHTEMVLREIARVKHGFGSRERGLEELALFLKSIGVADKQYRFADASGLSRLTLVTPATLSKVLLHMYASPHRETWMATLPVGGLDGTLYGRFAGAAATASGSIHAKTGSISHVSSLSGYAVRKDRQTYAFSIIANNYNCDHAPIRKLIDQVALALLQ